MRPRRAGAASERGTRRSGQRAFSQEEKLGHSELPFSWVFFSGSGSPCIFQQSRCALGLLGPVRPSVFGLLLQECKTSRYHQNGGFDGFTCATDKREVSLQMGSARPGCVLLTRVRGARRAHGGAAAADGSRTPRTGTVWTLSETLSFSLYPLSLRHAHSPPPPPLNHTPQFHLIQLKPQLAETYLGGAAGVCGGGRFNGAWSRDAYVLISKHSFGKDHVNAVRRAGKQKNLNVLRISRF